MMNFTNPYAGLLSPEENQQSNSNMLLNLGLGLLQNSGPSRNPVGFGQVLGQSGLQALQQQQQFAPQLFGAKLQKLKLDEMQRIAPIKAALTNQITQQPGLLGGTPGPSGGLLGGNIHPMMALGAISDDPGMLKLGEEYQKQRGYENVTQDDYGNWWGLNKSTMKVEQIPQGGDFTKFKTVEGTGATGLPEKQLVNPAAYKGKSVISIPGAPPTGYRYQNGPQGQTLAPITGGPADQLTTEQKNLLTESEKTVSLVSKLKDNFKDEYVGVKGSLGRANDQYTSQVFSGAGDPDRVKFTTDAASLTNNYIKLVTGATVGQGQETTRLMKAVPNPGDSPLVYKAKLEEMENNLKELPDIIKRSKDLAQSVPGPKKPAKASAPDINALLKKYGG
jgi:uncharacterized protein YxeA